MGIWMVRFRPTGDVVDAARIRRVTVQSERCPVCILEHVLLRFCSVLSVTLSLHHRANVPSRDPSHAHPRDWNSETFQWSSSPPDDPRMTHCISRLLQETIDMTIDFYYTPGSAPCRIVLLTAKAVGVNLNLKLINLFTGEHLKPEYIKLNPQHTVPTLNDNGFVLTESRAIAGYLVDQYGKNDSLYPKDPKKRALVDQKLYFDIGTLCQRFGDYYYPIAFGGAPSDSEKLKKLEEAFGFLDKFLEGCRSTGDSRGSKSEMIFGFGLCKYHNVNKWFAKCKKSIAGYEELNQSGLLQIKEIFDKNNPKK
uniref:Glutathione S-transferase n=2 Tax=Timema TaxID=61471 RepID=A0A7R9IHW5_9NEOP|nr:unnamed protein product [Timema tahoe]